MDNQELIDNWKEINKTTISLIKAIPKDKFHQQPFSPRFKSFAWEFSCIITTRKGYLKGFEEKKLAGNCFLEDDEQFKKSSKEKMITELKKTDLQILKILKEEKIKKINYFGKNKTKEAVICWLLQHEQLHYGKLILYFAQANLKIPQPIQKMWGKESFKPKVYKDKKKSKNIQK